MRFAELLGKSQAPLGAIYNLLAHACFTSSNSLLKITYFSNQGITYLVRLTHPIAKFSSRGDDENENLEFLIEGCD